MNITNTMNTSHIDERTQLKEELKEEMIMEFGDIMIEELSDKLKEHVNRAVKTQIESMKRNVVQDIMKLEHFFKKVEPPSRKIDNLNIDNYVQGIRQKYDGMSHDLDKFKHSTSINHQFPSLPTTPTTQFKHVPSVVEKRDTTNQLKIEPSIVEKRNIKSDTANITGVKVSGISYETDDYTPFGLTDEFNQTIFDDADQDYDYTDDDMFDDAGQDYEKYIGLLNRPRDA
jgi:hypothetical protein